MSSSTVFGQEYGYYKGIAGSSIRGAVLPPQAIPKSKKNKNWEKSHNVDIQIFNTYGILIGY